MDNTRTAQFNASQHEWEQKNQRKRPLLVDAVKQIFGDTKFIWVTPDDGIIEFSDGRNYIINIIPHNDNKSLATVSMRGPDIYEISLAEVKGCEFTTTGIATTIRELYSLLLEREQSKTVFTLDEINTIEELLDYGIGVKALYKLPGKKFTDLKEKLIKYLQDGVICG